MGCLDLLLFDVCGRSVETSLVSIWTAFIITAVCLMYVVLFGMLLCIVFCLLAPFVVNLLCFGDRSDSASIHQQNCLSMLREAMNGERA